MREDAIEVDKVLAMLDENMETKSKGLMEVVAKDGSGQIAKLLKDMVK